ncbi:flagellar hook-length control protein FliK [Shewanella inventionis]|uniref:Flagellar hook-length control protein FliK n=1 Tax=Shewanella inventionis TaxID=1738770 RepID=A0ABQ1IRI8_9GAMM|nr:flagellar hook-length control protein FliK [Shewanella inventionis]MCL1156734.1 flagellar hook-length control protein FliK [Shewanella inventionis]GGB50084.1 flagellar hook-length control protein FliK [Shewanella inventionis]
MQQMSNILLSNSNQNADVGAKIGKQDVENTSFLSVFNQASEQKNSFKPAADELAPAQAEQQIEDVDIEVELSESAESSQDNTDAEMIFAQLNMADSLGKRHHRDGNELPLIDKQGNYIGKNFTLEPIENGLEVIDTKLEVIDIKLEVINTKFEAVDTKFEAVDTKLEPLNLTSIELEQIDLEQIALEQHNIDFADSASTEADELFTETIHLDSHFTSSSQAIATLNPEQISSLTTYSQLSVKELQALDIKDLSELVSDFNLQAPVIDESILAMAELAQAELAHDDIASSVLNPLQQSELDNALAASVHNPNQAMNMSNTAKLNPALQPTANDPQQSAALMTSSLSVESQHILGDKSRIDGNIQPDLAGVKSLEKADFSVVLDSVAGKRVGESAVNINSASDGFEFFSDTSEVESKSLQNQSSFTPVHKSDVPQFQLSLRPQAQGEAGAQMQEMIQKFSPVMKQQLITMVSNGIQQAEIRLDPPELGHLTIKIQIQGDQTQVQFNVAQSQTRDLVEQAIPRLRDMLASEGLQLTDSQVSQGGGGRDQQQEQSESQGHTSDAQLDEISAQEASLMTNTSRSLHSAIDYYA